MARRLCSVAFCVYDARETDVSTDDDEGQFSSLFLSNKAPPNYGSCREKKNELKN